MNWKRIIPLALAVLMLCLTACQSGEFPQFSWPQGNATEQIQEQTLPQTTQGSAQPEAPKKLLEAIQSYRYGRMTQEIRLVYDENGRITQLETYRFDKGNLEAVVQTRYTYDPKGNLTQVEQMDSEGTCRWEYENRYRSDGQLESYTITEYYVDGRQLLHDAVTLYYDAQARLQGRWPDAIVTFDAAGRVLTSEAREDVNNGLTATVYREMDHTYPGFVITSSCIVLPEYEMTQLELSFPLGVAQDLFQAELEENWELKQDADGYLKRVLDEDGDERYLFIYN